MFTIKQIEIALIVFFLTVGVVVAEEDFPEQGTSRNDNGGFLELGLGLSSREVGGVGGYPAEFGIQAIIAGAYQYNGFFIDASQGSVDGLSLGYHFVRNDQWEVDLLISSARGRLVSHDSEDDVPNDSGDFELERQQIIDRRDSFYNGAGIKITKYHGNAIFQYRLVTDIHRNSGVLSSAHLGYAFQRRNWTFNGVVSAHYISEKTANYWYGVSAQEATTNHPVYAVGSAVEYVAKVGATYPLGENIVFRSSLSYALFDKDIARSTLQPGEYGINTSATISYVF